MGTAGWRRERNERRMQKKGRKDKHRRAGKGSLLLRGTALGLTAALLLGGCGSGEETGNGSAGAAGGSSGTGASAEGAGSGFREGAEDGQQVLGRYVESSVDLPEELQNARELWMDEEGLEMLSADGSLYRSTDQGRSWQQLSQAPAELQEAMEMGTILYFQQNPAGEIAVGYMEFPADEEGNISYENAVWRDVLYQADGSRIVLNPDNLSEQETIFAAACDGEGNFYLGSNSHIWRVNSQNGSLEVLAEISSSCDYLTVCGNYLMIQGEELLLYDLEAGKMAQQDTVLSESMAPWLGSRGDVGSRPYLLYQSGTEESLYVLTEQGLYRHTLYGSVMEQIIDGSLCSMSNPSMGFVNMLWDGEVFWVLYSGGGLKQYRYDAQAAAVPENMLRIYGLYEDEDIQMVISAFNQKYPELYISYEHPLSEETGMTREDAMKALSTQLAAGSGPDVLLLDGLDYDTYVEKGVLADLTETLDSTGERYMEAVMDSYLRDGKQYAAPMEIELPVFMGASDRVSGIASLEQLADLAESTRDSQPKGSLLGFNRAGDLLELLAPGSMDSWMTAEGKLDSRAVEEFLTQAGRIYEAQVSGLTEPEQAYFNEREIQISGVQAGLSGADIRLTDALFFGQPYALGLLSGSASVLDTYPMTAELLRQQGMVCVPMPGQSQNLARASKIWAVNAASGMQEAALELVAYAMSTQFLKENTLGRGATTNWDVLEEQMQEALENEEGYGASMGFTDINGRDVMISSGAPSREDLDILRSLLENCQGVSQCDSRIYEAVIETGQKALEGELTVEGAVKEIEKEVSLYLAE